MEIDLHLDRRYVLSSLALLLLVSLAVVGSQVTPSATGGPQILTPERWLAVRLARQAREETARLSRDLQDLQALMAERPDPVEAMLMAQRIYARHRDGTTATAMARRTLIEAARQVALYAAGGVDRVQVISAINQAQARLESVTP
ncbi:MAG: hypothetical protein Kow0047_31220 [Anaerolineae bacterium]